jgi:V/A-type H+-transporting ATPase subunit D
MSATVPVKVTRSSLVRLARRLDQVERGAALLQRKRDALVLQLFARVRPTIEARRRIDQQAALAYRALVDALAAAGHSDLAAFGWPSRNIRVECGLPASPAAYATPAAARAPPTLVRGIAARAMVPGQFEPAAEKAAQAFEALLESVLAAAPEESAIRRLGQTLAHTVRQVNVIEQRVAVDLTRALVHIRRTLDEREREEAVRLRRIAARAGPALRIDACRPPT